MSNIAYVTINPNNEYQNLATLAQTTFVSGTTYTLQVDGDVMLCESSTKPTQGGFHVTWAEPFQFEAGNDSLWVKNARQYDTAYINIAE